MTEGSGGKAAIKTRTMEIAVAAFILLCGAIVIFDSARLGAKWGEDGPEAGYFPFYIGLLLCIASVVNLLAALAAARRDDRDFVELRALKLVFSVLIPTAIYVGLISPLGLYLASTVFIAFFMRWLGKYAWWIVAAVSIGNSVVFFVVFEVWFKIPLPKGPLEAALGLN
ncbi:MAG: tripartite tricarboxylate transporter TctB family protein [Betaproteobacteria bacterium]|nr:tripartite tricarboxylate transporter TctB family protein [Betaproteobacteria bacterium]